METFAEGAIKIINELRTERLNYISEYMPLINAAQALGEYEEIGLSPEDVRIMRDEVYQLRQELKQVESSIIRGNWLYQGSLKRLQRRLGEANKKLAQYEQAEKEGRLVERPCKIGDTVFGIKQLKKANGTVKDILLSGKVICFKELENKKNLCMVSITKHFGYPTQWEIKDFGKTVFLTPEAAEAKLKERESK